MGRKRTLLAIIFAAAQIEAAVVLLHTRGVFDRPERVRVAAVVIATPTPAPTATPAPPPTPRPIRIVRRAAPVAPWRLIELGRIDIPKIGLSHRIFEGSSLRSIDHGPSHYENTAMPGHAGNTVWAGHRVTHSRPFYDIDRLAPGDRVTFTTAEGVFTYEITDFLIVSPNALSILNQGDDATFTIFGCHPKHSARQRYVVRGRLIESSATQAAG